MADEPAPEPEADPQESDEEPEIKGPADQIDWKAAARKTERELKKVRGELTAAQQANETAAEAALRTAREEAEKAARDELIPALTAARLEVAVLRLAGNKLADPTDALLYIKPDSVQKDDGTVDAKKLGAAIDALLAEKPYLAAGHKAAPVIPGGPRTPSEAPADMNAALRRAAGYA